MKILLVSSQDYIHHPIPSRHHYIFEELAKSHEIHVAHFHVSRGIQRNTCLHVDEATLFPFRSPLLHYTTNAPYHFHIFEKIIKENNIDIVVAAHVLAGTAVIHAARKLRVPIIFDLKDWFPDSAAAYFKNPAVQQVVRKGVWLITRHNLKCSDIITTVSPSLSDKLQTFGFNADIITNGVDTDRFKPMDCTSIRRRLGIEKTDFVIGFSGAVERWYALDEMIQALPELMQYRPDTRLLIVGGSLFTGYDAELQSLVHNLGLSEHVIFTGPKPYDELPQYIACMDVCTIPLSPPQWADIALPNKFFEYTACGKPIVMRPIPDVIRTGSPNLYLYRTRDEFVTQIRNLMNNPKMYDIDVEKYSWKEKAREFEGIFRRLT